jgi:hypothetical protein
VTQVNEISPRVLLIVAGSPFLAARLMHVLASAYGRGGPRNSGGPSCVVGDHGPVATPRSMTLKLRHRPVLAALGPLGTAVSSNKAMVVVCQAVRNRDGRCLGKRWLWGRFSTRSHYLNYIERDSEFSIAESRGGMAHLAERVHLAWREPSGRSPDRATPGC